MLCSWGSYRCCLGFGPGSHGRCLSSTSQFEQHLVETKPSPKLPGIKAEPQTNPEPVSPKEIKLPHRNHLLPLIKIPMRTRRPAAKKGPGVKAPGLYQKEPPEPTERHWLTKLTRLLRRKTSASRSLLHASDSPSRRNFEQDCVPTVSGGQKIGHGGNYFAES